MFFEENKNTPNFWARSVLVLSVEGFALGGRGGGGLGSLGGGLGLGGGGLRLGGGGGGSLGGGLGLGGLGAATMGKPCSPGTSSQADTIAIANKQPSSHNRCGPQSSCAHNRSQPASQPAAKGVKRYN